LKNNSKRLSKGKDNEEMEIEKDDIEKASEKHEESSNSSNESEHAEEEIKITAKDIILRPFDPPSDIVKERITYTD